MLEKLKTEVLNANRSLVQYGLVILTWMCHEPVGEWCGGDAFSSMVNEPSDQKGDGGKEHQKESMAAVEVAAHVHDISGMKEKPKK